MNVLVRVLRVLLCGLAAATVVGAVSGALARGGMRLFALVSDAAPGFSWTGSLFIAVTFACAALPSALVAAATRHAGARWLAHLLGTALLIMVIVPIGADEWSAALLVRGVAGGQVVLLGAVSVGFAVLVLGQPVIAGRSAALLARVPLRPVARVAVSSP
ncbi:hypothetical protein [Pseudonocardia sp. GCM10023141]|uniref:hypothetical protein n=1 Tax=Pseudonocardia sp. GCM10023141 TaxID=3252653 RepID=UPI003614391E